MLLTPKLRILLGLLTLTIFAALTVAAQTEANADGLSPSEPKKAETAKAPIVTSEKGGSSSHSGISRDPVEADRNSKFSARTSTEAAAPAPATSNDGWQFQVTPYFWMAGLHGTTGTPNRTVQVDQGFSDVFHKLNFALMGVFEAHKDKWSILTDAEYVSLEDDAATPGPLFSSVNAKIKLFIFEPDVGYRVFEDSDSGNFVDVVGGIRIWHINTDFTFAPGILPGTEVNANRTWVDAIGGLRGRAALSEKLFLTGKFDLGGGSSKFTYHIFGGGGYAVTPSIALIAGYRVLDVDYNRNNFVYNMNQRGPILGASFKF